MLPNPEDLMESWLPFKIALVIGVFAFIRTYMKGGECQSSETIEGKTVVITGANSGIGKETALDLARRGGKIILACRDLKKAEDVVCEIKQITKNDDVKAMELDLASFTSIKKFAKEFISNEEKLDILINNAGVMLSPYNKTEDGFETHFAVNYLGHFLLTHLLLDKLKAAPSARIVNVSALAHFAAAVRFNDLQFEESYSPREAYGQSKLAQVLFTKQLAKHLEGTKVTVNALHPGLVRSTNLLQYTPLRRPLLQMFLFPLLWLFLKSPKEGAQTSIYLATSSEVDGISGKYFSDCQMKPSSEAAQNPDFSERLWKISMEAIGVKN